MVNPSKPIKVDLSKEANSLQIFPCLPLLSSHRAGWDSIHLEYHHQPAYKTPESCAPQHLIAIQTEVSSPRQVEGNLDGRFHSEQFGEGDFLLIPANMTHSATWNTEHNFILLSLEPKYFARAAYEFIDPERVEPISHFLKSDQLIYQIGLVLKRELETNAGCNSLYVETMANALFVHLIRHYSSQKNLRSGYTGSLSKFELKQVIDYINSHLEHNLSLAELSAIVRRSPNYFCYLFKEATGIPPHQYVIQRRVERAKQLLFQEELTLTEIAYKVGFANQGHLNRHFKKRFGVTPSQMRHRS
ncbi:MAG: AraC family transcriptional regulator [Xenococcaceae cyanobacterium MO_188.B29]|nr:AraC family transcriptional regulator [Xenococcaceae cyanobacterium MO_188.B29]